MPGTFNYDRPKLVGVNVTGMLTTILVAEKPDALGAIGGTGTTGILDATFEMDADESGGADVQDLYRVTITPELQSDGTMNMKVEVTPIKGDGGADAVQTFNAKHPENMDQWQSNAGRTRQPKHHKRKRRR